jgi:hypothetical protein
MSSLPLVRTHSNQSYSSQADADSIEELVKKFASEDVQAIVHAICSMRETLMREAPDTVFAFMQDALPEGWQAVKHPYPLLLALLNERALLRRPGDKVDIPLLLVRALRRILPSNDDDEDGDDDGLLGVQRAQKKPVTRPAELTEALTAKAKELCLRGTYLSPRTFEAVARLYLVDLSEVELLQYAQACFNMSSFRECAEFLKAFHLETDAFPHDLLLQHLVSDKEMDVFASYLNQSPEFLKRYAFEALTHVAEYTRKDEAEAEDPTVPSGGNDPNLAAKLAMKFGLPLSDFPRVVYLKLCDVIHWIVRINKAREFGTMLCGQSLGLQRKLLTELMRSRNEPDLLVAGSFLEQWAGEWLREKETDGEGETKGSGAKYSNVEHRQFYENLRADWLGGQYPKPTEPTFEEELNKAIQLAEQPGVVTDPHAELLLPALPPSVSSTTLPQLFLRPSAITLVNSLSTLAEARSHLLNENCQLIGIDLEHLPENLDGLNIRPTLCQLLQISCKTRVFLFDLQVMHCPTEQERAASEANTAAVAASSSSATPAAASSSSSSSSSSSTSSITPHPDPVFPPIPVCLSSYTPTTPDLASAMADLLLELFIEPDLMKVGIGFAQDLRKMRGDFGHLVAFQVTLQSYIDLTPLLKQVYDPDAEERESARKQASMDAKLKSAARKQAAKSARKIGSTPSPPIPEAESKVGGYTHQAKKEGGLLKLVRMVLRRHLDKSEQISNWSNRPLSLPQVQYAALDAYACILILEECERKGIHLDPENIEAS